MEKAWSGGSQQRTVRPKREQGTGTLPSPEGRREGQVPLEGGWLIWRRVMRKISTSLNLHSQQSLRQDHPQRPEQMRWHFSKGERDPFWRSGEPADPADGQQEERGVRTARFSSSVVTPQSCISLWPVQSVPLQTQGRHTEKPCQTAEGSGSHRLCIGVLILIQIIPVRTLYFPPC